MRDTDAYRLFVALTLPDEVKAQVEKAQKELRRLLPQARITWTRREQFHLTLKFLGSVAAGRAPALLGAVQGACAGFAPLQLSARGLGCFPDLRYPRVLWVGVVDPTEALPKLQAAVETACAPFTAEAREQRFSGHVTLARIKGIGRPETAVLAKQVDGFADKSFGEWTADRADMMRSELVPEGARHSVLAAIPLGQAAPSKEVPSS